MRDPLLPAGCLLCPLPAAAPAILTAAELTPNGSNWAIGSTHSKVLTHCVKVPGLGLLGAGQDFGISCKLPKTLHPKSSTLNWP